MSDVYSLFVHGVGTQKSGYSKDAQRWLASFREPHKSYAQEVLWASVLDGAEDTMLKEVGRRGSANRPMQRLVISTLADALSFTHKREEIFDCLDIAYVRLRAPGPVHVAAHSLGVLLCLEWLRSRPRVQVSRFSAFGFNGQLFNLGVEKAFVVPTQLRAPGTFHCYFDPQDALGWPCGHWFPGAVDHQVSVGGWLTGWWGLSHTAYYGDKSFWRRVARDLG